MQTSLRAELAGECVHIRPSCAPSFLLLGLPLGLSQRPGPAGQLHGLTGTLASRALAFWPKKRERRNGPVARCPSLPHRPCPGSRSELSVPRAWSVPTRGLGVTAGWRSFRRRAVHAPSGLHAADRRGSEGLWLERAAQEGGWSGAERSQNPDQLGGGRGAPVVHAPLGLTPGQM